MPQGLAWHLALRAVTRQLRHRAAAAAAAAAAGQGDDAGKRGAIGKLKEMVVEVQVRAEGGAQGERVEKGGVHVL